MRMYDRISGMRFDANHPMWKLHMKNKDGSVKSRMDWKLVKKLQAEGVILLVPSVSEIAGVANGFGVFRNASVWGMRLGVQAAIDELPNVSADGVIQNLNLEGWRDRSEQRAEGVMAAPREKGSELHEVFHLMKRGEISAPTDDQLKCFAVMNGVVTGLNLRGEVKTEVEFTTDAYGGTCDLTAGTFGLDWKTVQKDREPRNSEILQFAAYAKHFGWSHGEIVYIRQDTWGVTRLPLTSEDIEVGYTAFLAALALHNSLLNIEKLVENHVG